MLPDIAFFGLTITWYSVFVALGAVSTLLFVVFFTIKKGFDESTSISTLLFSCIGIFLGSHLLYGLTNIQYIRSSLLALETKDLLSVFHIFKNAFGGAVYYGGLLGGILFAYLYLRNKDVQKDQIIGVCSLCIPLFHFFGRLGCFSTGCCYGIESSFGFDLKHSLSPECAGVTRFPVQLLEAFFNLAIFFFLFFLFNSKKKKGCEILLLYLLLYPTGRFFLEFLRGDKYRGFVGVFSTSQFISLLIIALILCFLIIKKAKQKTFNS